MDRFIKDILNKYNLSLVKRVRVPDGKAVRSYVLVAKSARGTKYTVKVFDSSDWHARERFIDEIGYVRGLRSRLSYKYRKRFPQIKWYSRLGDNPYYIYKYIDGKPLGRFIDDFGIKWGRFKHRNFREFIKFFDAVEGLDMKDFEPKPRSWGKRVVRKELQHYLSQEFLPAELYDQVRTFIAKYQNRTFKYKVLSHRDLYPENIIMEESGSTRFAFLDWEYFSYVPTGFDAAFLYLLFWREGYWKAKVYSHFYHKYENDDRKGILNVFNASFRFCLVLLAVRFLYQLDAFGDKKSEDYEDARESFLTDLKSALAGTIVKPANIKFFLEKHDIEQVAEGYDIGNVRSYEVFYASKGNTVTRVDTKIRSYIFRFYSPSRSKNLILRELQIFEKLSNAGVKTYDVIQTKNGELFLEPKIYGKKRRVAVLTYIKGNKIRRSWNTEKSVQRAGRMLRKIHTQNIIHGDYSRENVLYVKSKLSGVIDFEWGRFTTSRKAKFYDMAKAIALWLIDIRGKKLSDQVFIMEFLKGYYGEVPSDKQLRKIMDAVVLKIEEERHVFMTTVDRRTKRNGYLGQRFDSAVEKVRQLI